MNWFDLLSFFQILMPGAAIVFYGVPVQTDEGFELDVQTETRWHKARIIQSGKVWYIHYPLTDTCTVMRAIEPEHYEFIVNYGHGHEMT